MKGAPCHRLAPSCDREVKEWQEAMSHLFAGAIGLLKNPGSHRHVGISEPTEAVELLCLASYPLRVVDMRTRPAAGPRPQRRALEKLDGACEGVSRPHA